MTLANKAQGIVFEAGRQYTFLLTLGLDGEEIAFSIPTVSGFNTDAVVWAPLPCGYPIKGYTTASYSNTGVEDLCWTTQNIAEGTAAYTSYDPGGANPQSGRGWYYDGTQGDAACKELGSEWAMPSLAQWEALRSAFGTLTPGVGTTGTAQTLRDDFAGGSAKNGFTDGYGYWADWDTLLWLRGRWNTAYGWDAVSGSTSVTDGPTLGSYGLGVRCVRSL
ncbi:hypothetical protein AGMMS49525_13210 [Bacteroidia bacterium]|nr:hypothetical protein AGMMS49525_13210 [Bacteroidia bacterium]